MHSTTEPSKLLAKQGVAEEGGSKEPFSALVQQAVSKKASRIFNYGEHVPVHIDTAADGVFGSVQPLIPGVI